MGAVQRLATVVIIGLVAIATILVLVVADESNRIEATQAMQQKEAVERAQANYVSLCLQCHGPAGEGYEEKGTGRIGMPLGGSSTSMNQHAVNAKGTPVAGGMDARAAYLNGVLHNGRGAMPAWGQANGGPLNDAQIEELVVFIQHADWNEVYNHVIEVSGGYPTPVPVATKAPEPTAVPGAGLVTSFEIDMVDIAFQPTEITIPADTEVTIKLVNKGAAQHNFHVDALGIVSDTLNGGESTEIKITAVVGEYDFYCAIPGHKEAGMVGKIKVVPASELGGGSAAPADSGASTAASSVALSAVDIAWEPTTLEIAANTDVTITVTNNGAATHNFYIEGTQIASGDLMSGSSEQLVVNLPPGEYTYYCAIPGHKEAGMVGKLVVK